MEAMREAWTDDRLDDLNRKVDEGFRRVDADIRALRIETKAEFNSLRSEMNERFEGLEARFDARFDSLQRTLILFSGAMIAALIGLIATQV